MNNFNKTLLGVLFAQKDLQVVWDEFFISPKLLQVLTSLDLEGFF